MQKTEALYVTAAAYDDETTALADYAAINAVYDRLGTSTDFDAAVLKKDNKGRVQIVKTREQPSRHGAKVGLGWGLAGGLVAALFPAVGVFTALAAGGAAGSMIGALAGHATKGMSRADLKQVGELLDNGQYGMIVVYATANAEQITRAIKATRQVRVAIQDAMMDELTEAMSEAKGYSAPTKTPAKV